LAKLGKSVPVQFRKQGVWAPQLSMFLLWFQFLQISPSYEIARRRQSGLFTDDDRVLRPADFNEVLAVYDDLGDVLHPPFNDWWQDRGIENFGYHGDKPTVRQIATLQRGRNVQARFWEQATAYLEGKWQTEGQQNTLIIAIPANLPKARILKKVAQFLDATGAEEKRLKAEPPKYRLHGKKHDEGSLIRYLEAVKCRALNPDVPLWKIGAMIGLSQTYSKRLANAASDDDCAKDASPDDKNALKILTSRAISRGRIIAENAARGVFPSYAACPNQVSFSEERMRDLVLKRDHYQKMYASL